jgi:hypothetical protein
MKCKNCKKWNNKQAELDYSKFYGICTSKMHVFDSSRGSDCVVLDRENLSSKYIGINRFESISDIVPIGRVEKSRYCLVTDEDFGCINFIKK